MKIARHEDAVAMLTGGLSYVTLVVVRERVINKRMLPLSKLQDQSSINKRLAPKVSCEPLMLSHTHARASCFHARGSAILTRHAGS